MIKSKLSHASSIWPVKDMNESIDFYTNILGFSLEFTWEDPPTYVVLKRDDIGIHLTLNDNYDPGHPPANALMIFVYDVDAIWNELTDKQVKVVSAIADRDYGMRDFDIEDPNGYRIVFGAGLKE